MLLLLPEIIHLAWTGRIWYFNGKININLKNFSKLLVFSGIISKCKKGILKHKGG